MKIAIAMPIFLVFIAGCQSVPVTNYDYSETARFGDYQTFSWLTQNPVGFHKDMDAHVSPLIGQHLKEAAISAFAEVGLRYVEDPSNADVLMAFTLGSRERIAIDGYYGYYGYAISGDETAGGYWYDNNQNLGRFVEGQICVDLFDRQSRQPVWHGTAEETLSQSEVEYWRERVPAIMDYIAQGYPPELSR
ncbi:MAG: DUF4136 domain-containing protein [Pseudomonadales bacterium]